MSDDYDDGDWADGDWGDEDKEDRAHARRGDPDESHWAADSVRITPNRAYVVVALKRIGEPVTHERLVETYQALAASGVVGPQSDSGIRSRCTDLTRKEGGFLVRKSALKGTTKSGRPASMWELAT